MADDGTPLDVSCPMCAQRVGSRCRDRRNLPLQATANCVGRDYHSARWTLFYATPWWQRWRWVPLSWL